MRHKAKKKKKKLVKEKKKKKQQPTMVSGNRGKLTFKGLNYMSHTYTLKVGHDCP